MEPDEEDLGALYDQSGNVRDMEDHPGVGHNQGIDEDDALDDLDLTDLMKEGRKMLLKKLIREVRDGIATPAQENTLRQMLKDNGMVMGDPDEGASRGTEKRKEELPQFPSRQPYEQ
ncbi:hypothetical protein [Brucella intermedia]|uniref:hypothetical protein n=1 Tax=Brucella intermedia TaxID=94625 RepID=UPI00224ABE75|nr:hypothetical protein [Brucella intermedia]